MKYLIVAFSLFLCLPVSVKASDQKVKEPIEITKEDLVRQAQEGFDTAQYLIGSSVLFDEEILGHKFQDRERALNWLDQAIEQDSFYGWLVATKLEDLQKPVLAEIYYRKAFKAGDPSALIDIGQLYKGTDHSLNANKRAKTYYEAALQYGELSAHGELGDFYLYGTAGERDLEKAKHHYKALLQFSEELGYERMGQYYLSLPKPDHALVLENYNKAANLGSYLSIFKLIEHYQKFGDKYGLTQFEYIYWRLVEGYYFDNPPKYIPTNLPDDILNKLNEKAKEKAKIMRPERSVTSQ